MWLYLVVLLGLWTLLCLFRERQVVSHLQDKHVFITGCDSGFGNLLARQLDRRGMRVLAACLIENGAEELRSKTSDRLETAFGRELSYFGVKVAVIEPVFFKTDITNIEGHLSNTKIVLDQVSSEVKEIYGENFLASIK